jgi:hypothetical protein
MLFAPVSVIRVGAESAILNCSVRYMEVDGRFKRVLNSSVQILI